MAVPAARRLRGSWLRASQESRELLRIEPVAAHHSAIEQQHRDMKAVPAGQLRVGIDINEFQGRQRQGLPKALKLRQHFLAKPAVFAMEQGQTRVHRQRGGGPWRDIAPRGGADLTEFAMARTVSGGTSPTAVTLRPSITVEKAEVEPNWVTPLSGPAA